jgi:uncharacterized protein (DUF2141 family)
MLGRAFIVSGILLILLAQAHAEKKYTVSGVVTFPEADVICIALYTFEQFKAYKNNPLPPPPFSQIVKPTAAQKKAGRVPFKFTGIPKGTYGIIAFRDLNDNRILDSDNKGRAKKPLSTYRLKDFSGKWDDMKFEVNGDMGGIEIRF